MSKRTMQRAWVPPYIYRSKPWLRVPQLVHYYECADWYTTRTNNSTITVPGVSWASGDIVVFIVGLENDAFSIGLTTPTGGGLSFGSTIWSLAVPGGGNTGECASAAWVATAASPQQNQTISTTFTSAGSPKGGAAVYVISGGPTGTANVSSNNTESAFTFTPTANSVVIYAGFDWNADASNRTLTTASGTPVEDRDSGNGVNYGQHLGHWIGVANSSQSWGLTSYTSMKIAHGVVEVLVPAGPQTVPDPPISLVATPGNTQVVLTWTAPFNGNSPITDYIVQYRVTPQ